LKHYYILVLYCGLVNFYCIELHSKSFIGSDKLVKTNILNGGKQFFTKIEFSHKVTKTQKKKATHFFASCLCVFVATVFRSKAAKK